MIYEELVLHPESCAGLKLLKKQDNAGTWLRKIVAILESGHEVEVVCVKADSECGRKLGSAFAKMLECWTEGRFLKLSEVLKNGSKPCPQVVGYTSKSN